MKDLPDITEKDNVKSYRKIFNISVKTIFSLLFVYLIVIRMYHSDTLWNAEFDILIWQRNGNINLLVLTILLMPVNWLLESKKWQILMSPIEKISLNKAIKGVLSGISFGMITPNRIGEYVGRMTAVQSHHNWHAAIATLVSSFSQNIWNIGLGLTSAVLFFPYTAEMLPIHRTLSVLFVFVFFVFSAFLYLNIGKFHQWMLKQKIFSRFKKVLESFIFLYAYDSFTLLKVSGYAFLRYFTYLTQYLFLLYTFGAEINIFTGLAYISIIYLAQTSIPLPPVLGFLARGEIALQLATGININPLTVLTATYGLWLLNLVLPAIIGLWVILRSNLWETFGFKTS